MIRPIIFCIKLNLYIVAVAEIAIFERAMDEEKEDPMAILNLLKDTRILITAGLYIFFIDFVSV